MVGGAAPHGRPQVTQTGHVGRAGERGETWAKVEEKWTDYVAENRWMFGIAEDWGIAALDSGVR